MVGPEQGNEQACRPPRRVGEAMAIALHGWKIVVTLQRCALRFDKPTERKTPQMVRASVCVPAAASSGRGCRTKSILA